LQVANNLLPEDLQEMEGLGHSVLGLFFSFYASDPCLAFFNKYGDIAGLGGISYVSPIQGSIWMICTPHIKKNPVTFVKQCKKWLSEQKQYKILTNKVDARNKFHHKLLKLLGFKSIRKVITEPHQLPYIEIVKLCA